VHCSDCTYRLNYTSTQANYIAFTAPEVWIPTAYLSDKTNYIDSKIFENSVFKMSKLNFK